MLAILGAISGLLIVFKTQKAVAVAPIFAPPTTSPYEYAIAGTGIIEASSDNIAIGSPFNDIITKVYVVEGDYVKVGDPLFELDVRSFEAQASAAEATLREAIITLADKSNQYSFYQRLKDTRAVSEIVQEQARYAVLEAEENVKIAQANLEIIKTNIERSTIRAPIEGQILQVNVHVGELSSITALTTITGLTTQGGGSLILMGRVQPMRVRIDIDEYDAWRYKKGARATAVIRGNSAITFPLEFIRLEPYVVPKSSFTGETAERVDTRVLQVLYNFEKGNLPVYMGQVLSVYIEADPVNPPVAKK